MLFEDQTGTLAERAERMQKEYGQINEVMEIIGFMNDKGSRSLCVPKSVSQAA
jgi:hypothetical protein